MLLGGAGHPFVLRCGDPAERTSKEDPCPGFFLHPLSSLWESGGRILLDLWSEKVLSIELSLSQRQSLPACPFRPYSKRGP